MEQSGWLHVVVALVLIKEPVEGLNYDFRRAPCMVYTLPSRAKAEAAYSYSSTSFSMPS